MITFNGVSSTEFGGILSVMQVKRPMHPGTNYRSLRVPARDGEYYFGKELREQYVSFRLSIQSTSNSARRAIIRNICDWLDTDDVAVLTLTDEPDLRYNAVLVEPVNVDEFASLGMTDVTFLIPDGCAYSDATDTVEPTGEIQNLYLGGADGGTYLLGDATRGFPWTEYSTETWDSLALI